MNYSGANSGALGTGSAPRFDRRDAYRKWAACCSHGHRYSYGYGPADNTMRWAPCRVSVPTLKVEFRLAKANLIARLLVSLHDQPAHDVSPMLAVEISETH